MQKILWIALFLVIARSACAQLSAEQALPLAESRDAWQPAAAWGQDAFLVAWKSGHLGEGDLRKGFNYIGDIAACRVDKTGKLPDAQPFAICAAADLQERPRIAFGGGVFLVVWQDFRNGKDWDVYGARVSPDGKVLDPDGIAISSGPHNQALPELAWDGQAFQVVWQDYRSDSQYEIYGARVGADGKVADALGQKLVSAEGGSQRGSFSRYGGVIAGSGREGESLLFWRGTSNNQKLPIAGCQWIKGGAANSESAYVTVENKETPGGGAHANFPMCLAAGPETYLGAWTTQTPKGRGNAANDAHAGIFSKDGNLARKFLLFGSGGVGGGRIRHPSAAWDGSRFVVAWDQYDEAAAKAAKAGWPVEVVCAAQIAADGAVTSPVPIAGSATAPAIRPCVASDGAGTALIAYEQHPENGELPIKIGYRILTK